MNADIVIKELSLTNQQGSITSQGQCSLECLIKVHVDSTYIYNGMIDRILDCLEIVVIEVCGTIVVTLISILLLETRSSTSSTVATILFASDDPEISFKVYRSCILHTVE